MLPASATGWCPASGDVEDHIRQLKSSRNLNPVSGINGIRRSEKQREGTHVDFAFHRRIWGCRLLECCSSRDAAKTAENSFNIVRMK
jgi:hypothetical protein